MTQKRKALFLPFNSAIEWIDSAIHGAGIERWGMAARASRESADSVR
jgi:hypothetical protein